VFHYGIEVEGLKCNSPELGEVRRRVGVGAKVEVTFDPSSIGSSLMTNPGADIF